MSRNTEDNEYDPYKFRDKPNLTSNVETLINLIKGILGTGILAMPEAFKYSGFIVGIIVSIVLTIIETYCLHLIHRSMYQVCKSKKIPQINYADTFYEAFLVGPECLRKFANAAPYIVNFFIIVHQVGVGCIYAIFICSNIKDVVDVNTAEKYHLNIELYVLILLFPLIALTSIRNMKAFAAVSYLGNIVTAVGLIIIYYYCFRDIGPITDRRMYSDFKLMPLFMGTVMYALISLGVMLSVESSMKYPQNWGGYFGILNIVMGFITVLTVFTGCAGYWRYGADSLSSITLNLDITEPLAWTVRIAFAIALFLSFPLQMFSSCEIMWEQYVAVYMATSKHKLLWEYVLKGCLVLLAIFLAISIPRMGLFISLFGGFCLSMVALALPPLLDICLHYPDNFGRFKHVLLRDIALIIFGLICFVVGTGTSLYKIIKSFQ